MKAWFYICPVILVCAYMQTLSYAGPWFERSNAFVDLVLTSVIYLVEEGVISGSTAHSISIGFALVFQRIFDLVVFIPFLLTLLSIPIKRVVLYWLVFLTFGIYILLTFIVLTMDSEGLTLWGLITVAFWLFLLPCLVFVNRLFGVENKTTK